MHLHSDSDIRVNTSHPSLSFSDVFVCRHSLIRNSNLTSRLPPRFKPHPRSSFSRPCADLPLPAAVLFKSGFDAYRRLLRVRVTVGGRSRTRMRSSVPRCTAVRDARASCVAQAPPLRAQWSKLTSVVGGAGFQFQVPTCQKTERRLPVIQLHIYKIENIIASAFSDT